MQCIRSIKQADRELVRSPRCRYQAPDQDSGSWFGYGIGIHQIILVVKPWPRLRGCQRTKLQLVSSLHLGQEGTLLGGRACIGTLLDNYRQSREQAAYTWAMWAMQLAVGSGVAWVRCVVCPPRTGHLEVCLCLSGQLSSPRCQPRGSEP